MAVQPFLPQSGPMGPNVGVQAYDPIEVESGTTSIYNPTPAAPSVGIVDEPRVDVIAPDGTLGSVPHSKLGYAQSQGFKLDTAESKAIREYVAENKGLSGAAKVALDGFLDQATFGVYGALDEHATKDPLDKAKAAALKQDHALANIIGQAGGFGLSLAYGGEVFKAAGAAGKAAEGAILGERMLGTRIATKLVQEGVPAAEAAAHGAGLARRIIANGAKYATEGAAFAAPKAATEVALGDPERAAETLMYGLGGGAVLGLAGGVAGGVKRALTGTARGAALPGGMTLAGKVREWGDEQAISALDMTQKYSKKIAQRDMKSDAARIFRESGVGELAGDAEAIAERFGEVRQETGAKIGAIYKTADEAGAKAATTYGELAASLSKSLEKEGLDAIGSVGASANAREWVEREVLGPVMSITGAPRDASGRFLKQTPLSMEQLHQIRVKVDGATRFDRALTNDVNSARIGVRGALTDLIEQKLDSAGSSLSRDLRAELAPLNRQYATVSILADNAENNIARTTANRRHSLTDYAGNAIGGIVGGAIGGGVGSVAGAAIGGAVNNQLRRKAPAALSGAAHGVADWLEHRSMAGVLEANHAAADQLARIPALLNGLGETEGRVGTLAVDALTSYARKLSAPHTPEAEAARVPEHARAFSALSKALTEMTTNPERMAQSVKALTAPFEAGAPNIAAQLAIKAPLALQHLQDTMPKSPMGPQTLFSKPREWTPSKAQAAEWGKRWSVVDDPFSVMQRLADRSLTRAEVDTLRAVYPKLHEEMVSRVMLHATDPKAKPLPFGDRDRLSMLLGVQVGGTDYGAIQAAYQKEPPAPKGGGGQMKAPNVASDATRLSLKGGG